MLSATLPGPTVRGAARARRARLSITKTDPARKSSSRVSIGGGQEFQTPYVQTMAPSAVPDANWVGRRVSCNALRLDGRAESLACPQMGALVLC